MAKALTKVGRFSEIDLPNDEEGEPFYWQVLDLTDNYLIAEGSTHTFAEAHKKAAARAQDYETDTGEVS